MAKHRRTSRRDPGTPTAEEARRDDPGPGPARRRVGGGQPGESYWSVDGGGWSAIRPGLPGDVVDLLAPPIVVGVARVPVAARPAPPAVSRSATVGGVRATAPVPGRAVAGVKRGPFLDTGR